MALDDFARRDPATGAKGAAAAGEGEDLFDFPVVEMTADASGPPPQKSKSERGVPNPPPVLPAKKPVAPPPSMKDLASANSPMRHHAPHGDPRDRTTSESPRDSATSVGATQSPSHAPAPRVHARTLPPIAEVAAAVATAIAEQETVEAHGSDVDSLDAALPRPRNARREITGTLAWMAIGALALVNVAGFFALWRSNRSFASAVDGLRDDLAVAAHDMQLAPIPPGGPIEPRADVAAGENARGEAGTTRIESTPEEAALTLARKEIELGRFGAARVRLHRLLAIADRFDSSTRADLEARASFLVGESYAVQLERRLETAR